MTQTDSKGNVVQSTSYTYNPTTGQMTGSTVQLTKPGGGTGTPVTTTYAYDSFGNVSNITPSGGLPINFNYNAVGQLKGTTDTTAGPATGPIILASSATSGQWTSTNSQVMSWGAPQSSLPVTGFSYAEDAGAGNTANAPGGSLAWNNIPDGQHFFAMKAVDSAGNWSPQSVFNLWIDTTPPQVANVTFTPNPIPQGAVNVTATASVTDAGSGLSGAPQIRWAVGNSTPQNWSSYVAMTAVAGSPGQWTASFVESGSGSTLYYQIASQDVAGNSEVYNGSQAISGPAGDTGALMPPWALLLLFLLFLAIGNVSIFPKPRPA